MALDLEQLRHFAGLYSTQLEQPAQKQLSGTANTTTSASGNLSNAIFASATGDTGTSGSAEMSGTFQISATGDTSTSASADAISQSGGGTVLIAYQYLRRKKRA